MLAEKYRPRAFEQVIGQDKVISAMRWYLDQPMQSGLALLLTGPSGSGKTTLAECAARYWGCTDWDIHRIESAECDVAALRDLDNHLTVYGHGRDGRKCYLIDEIHTVTGRAADRLLSICEHLPRHVCLFATTTESDWCALTLFSRWARLTLQKPSSAAVATYLEQIAAQEGLPIPSDPQWASKLMKYHGLNLRDQLNQLPSRLLEAEPVAA